jgi:hypothetical protein
MPMLDFLLAARLITGVAFMAGLAVVFRVRLKPAPVVLVALGAAIICAGTIVRLYPILGFDYRIFWEAGRDVWAGSVYGTVEPSGSSRAPRCWQRAAP